MHFSLILAFTHAWNPRVWSNWHILFPFDGCWGLGRHIVAHPIDAANLIDNAIGNLCKKIVVHVIPNKEGMWGSNEEVTDQSAVMKSVVVTQRIAQTYRPIVIVRIWKGIHSHKYDCHPWLQQTGLGEGQRKLVQFLLWMWRKVMK